MAEKETFGGANYNAETGDSGRKCDECVYFAADRCDKWKRKVAPDGICNAYSPRPEGRLSMSEAIINPESPEAMPMRSTDLYITRVSLDPQTRQRRWYATASGTKKDLYGDNMTVMLFKDFIKRIERGDEAPEPFKSRSWNGGLPYLSVAHYLDLDGFGVAGKTDQVWADGDIFKAKGTFSDSTVGRAAYEAVKRDIESGKPPSEKVRISIAFIDWGHGHEGAGGVFARKSLLDRCPHCDSGLGKKSYREGQIVHLALTRRPAYPDTEIQLEERAMTTRLEDASSIVGDELAKDLEKRSGALTERAEQATPGVVVVRDDSSAAAEKDKAEAKPEVETSGSATVEEMSMAKDGFGTTLDEAEAFLARSKESPILDGWGILAAVIKNASARPAAERESLVEKALVEFRDRLDVVNLDTLTAVRAFLDKAPAPVAPSAPGAPVVPAPAPHVLDEGMENLRAVYDEALGTANATAQEKLAAIQPAMNSLAEVIMRSVEPQAPAAEAASAGETVELTKAVQALTGVVATLVGRVDGIEKRSVTTPRAPEAPARRGIRMVPALPASVTRSATGKLSIRDIARRSVGLTE